MSSYVWLIIVIAVIVIAASLIQSREKRAMLPLLKRQAEKLGGEVKSGNLLYYPRLLFFYHDTEMTVSAMPGGSTRGTDAAGGVTGIGSGDITYAQFKRDSQVEFRIRKKDNSLQMALDDALGWQKLEIEDPFSDAYLVQGKPLSAIEVLLTPEVQQDLMAYRNRVVDIQFKKGTFVLSIDGITQGDGDYDRVISTTKLFHDGLVRI